MGVEPKNVFSCCFGDRVMAHYDGEILSSDVISLIDDPLEADNMYIYGHDNPVYDRAEIPDLFNINLFRLNTTESE